MKLYKGKNGSFEDLFLDKERRIYVVIMNNFFEIIFCKSYYQNAIYLAILCVIFVGFHPFIGQNMAGFIQIHHGYDQI